jgi:hypothetical protein
MPASSFRGSQGGVSSFHATEREPRRADSRPCSVSLSVGSMSGERGLMPRPDDRPVPDSLASRVPNPARGAVGRRANRSSSRTQRRAGVAHSPLMCRAGPRVRWRLPTAHSQEGDTTYAAQAEVSESVGAGVKLQVSPRSTSPTGTIVLSGRVLGSIPSHGVLTELLVHYLGLGALPRAAHRRSRTLPRRLSVRGRGRALPVQGRGARRSGGVLVRPGLEPSGRCRHQLRYHGKDRARNGGRLFFPRAPANSLPVRAVAVMTGAPNPRAYKEMAGR